jgi:hypothetical protein
MANALNMTMRLKQDPASLAKLSKVKEVFHEQIQGQIDAALRKSQLVHFARVLVIDDKYIQVITEYDGDPIVYTDFFRVSLPVVFKTIFDLVDDAPPWDELNDRDAFFKYSSGKNLRALGGDPADPHTGYLFSAYGDRTVKQLLKADGAAGQNTAAAGQAAVTA